jgi:hypothetical protein
MFKLGIINILYPMALEAAALKLIYTKTGKFENIDC